MLSVRYARPCTARHLLSHAPAVGVSGSRVPRPASMSAFHAVWPLVCPSAQVLTGCATGIDKAARSLAAPSQLQVFQASEFGSFPWCLPRRSQACVQATRAASGLWLSFPVSQCPAGLVPSASASKCFSGFGSGSWASLAFALGLGLPCLVFLAWGGAPPAAFGLRLLGQWGSEQQGGSWWWAPGQVQPSMF